LTAAVSLKLPPTLYIVPVWARGVISAGETILQSIDFFVFKADGSFAGTQETMREIELGTNADEYTGTATSAFFNPADQLVSTGCATSTATRLE